jgi:putative Mg2+ transporter-C (MgtC) family protein
MPEWGNIYQQLKDVTILSTFAKLLLAVVLGGLVGIERSRKRRVAGLRTHILVCMGATLAMITNLYIMLRFGLDDPTRMGAQVISGIGFLGAGTIIVDRLNQVRGLTTAAGLWACACMGLALGAGFYSGAIIGFVFILLAIVVLNRLEQRIIDRVKVLEISVEFGSNRDFSNFTQRMKERNILVNQIDSIRHRKDCDTGQTRVVAVLSLKFPKSCRRVDIIQDICNEEGLVALEEVH